MVDDGSILHIAPDEFGKGAVFLLDPQEGLRVAHHCGKFESIADDARVVEERGDFFLSIGCDFDGIVVVTHFPVVFPLF